MIVESAVDVLLARLFSATCLMKIKISLELIMYFLGLGIVLLSLKYLEIGPVAIWEWWQVLVPFGLAVLWWSWADWSGYTKRRAMERLDKIKKARIDRNLDALVRKPPRK